MIPQVVSDTTPAREGAPSRATGHGQSRAAGRAQGRAAGRAQSRAAGVAFVASVVGFIGYFVLLHWLIVGGAAPWLAVAMVVAPWLAAAGSLARRWPGAVAGLVALLAVVVVVVVFEPSLARRGAALATHVDALLFVENGIFLIALCTLFAGSLRGPNEPLVTRLARIARRGDMPPPVMRYTRAVTAAWAIFFAAAALASAVLFATQSRAVWSGFVNLLLWPLTGAMFALEYAVRVRVLRDVQHLPIAAGIAAFRHRGQRPDVVTTGPLSTGPSSVGASSARPSS